MDTQRSIGADQPISSDQSISTDQAISTRIAAVAGAGFTVVVVALWVYWPAGVALGLVFGVVALVVIGRAVHAAAAAEPHDGRLELDSARDDDDLWQDFRRLRVRLGDDWPDFSRAVLLVTRAQTASAAALQRELGLTGGAATRLLGLLEREGFVGAAAGTRPRAVLVAAGTAPELSRLLHA